VLLPGDRDRRDVGKSSRVGDRFTATYYGAMAVAVDPTYRP